MSNIVLRRPLLYTTPIHLNYTGTSTSVALPTDQTISLRTLNNCYYLLGDSTITVTTDNGILLPAGIEYIAKGINTHIAVIRSSVNGKLVIVGGA